MTAQIKGEVKVTFRPGLGQTGDDWHTEVTIGDKSYVAISKWRWLACLRAGTLLLQIIRDLERKPVLPASASCCEDPKHGVVES